MTVDTRAGLERDGYAILERVLEPAAADRLRADLERLERDLAITPADNAFEGSRTLRIYNLLAHGSLYEQIAVHPEVLPVVEDVLDPGCLISSLSSISIGPGESAQPVHADDQLLPIPKPHPATVCNTMWALTDFTAANGATRLVPGTHRARDNPDLTADHDTIPAEMNKGDVLLWHGSLWHGGGANTTDQRRVGIALNYCAGYIRQQENQQLGLDQDLVAGFEPRLQELVGYGVYQGLVGHIDKENPRVLLGRDGTNRMVWDRAPGDPA